MSYLNFARRTVSTMAMIELGAYVLVVCIAQLGLLLRPAG
jgi:hypothetical protein